MIRNILLMLALVASVIMPAGFEVAQAGCTGSACSELQQLQALPSYRGPQATTRDPMACIFPMHRASPTAIVVRQGEGVHGPETGYGFRIQPEHWTQATGNRWYRETCFRVSFLEHYRSTGITLCGDNGNVYLSPSDIDHIIAVRRIPVTVSPACMYSGTCKFGSN